MKFYGVYQCKQCGTRFNVENELGGLYKDAASWMFIKDNPFGSVEPYENPKRIITHKCDDSTIGMAELIGWRRIV